MQIIRNADRVIEALGGIKHVAQLFDVGQTAVYNWRRLNFLPAKTFVICTRELSRRGFIAPPELWRDMHRGDAINGKKRRRSNGR